VRDLILLVASTLLLGSRYSLDRFPTFHTGVLSLLAAGKILGVGGLAWVLIRRLRASGSEIPTATPPGTAISFSRHDTS